MDNVQGQRFFLPIYKDQSVGANEGILAAAGDIITVLLKGVKPDGTHPTQSLTLLSISDHGLEITWEHDATNQYARSGDIHSVAPVHQYVCPVAGNISLVGTTDVDAPVTSFSVNGVTHTETYPVTAVGAAALEADLQTALQEQGLSGEVTVVWVDAATDYLKVYVTNTTATIILTPGGTLA
jgi:hypothetical protein